MSFSVAKDRQTENLKDGVRELDEFFDVDAATPYVWALWRQAGCPDIKNPSEWHLWLSS